MSFKKLKALKKEKFDEATARKRAEEEAKSLKKDKQNLEKENKSKDEQLEQSVKLAEQHRTLFQVSQTNYDSLKLIAQEDTSLEDLPELDQELLDLIAPQTEDESDEEQDSSKKAARKKTSTDSGAKKKKKKKSSKK